MFAGMRRTHVSIVGVLPTGDAAPEHPENRERSWGPTAFGRRIWSRSPSSGGSGQSRAAAGQTPEAPANDAAVLPATSVDSEGGAADSSSNSFVAGLGAHSAGAASSSFVAGLGAHGAGALVVDAEAGELQPSEAHPQGFASIADLASSTGTSSNADPHLQGSDLGASLRDADGHPITFGYTGEAQNAEGADGDSGRDRGRLDSVLRMLGIRGNAAQPLYPMRFKALVSVVVALSMLWLGNYIFVVMPTIEQYHGDCKYNDNQLRYNAKILFVYFAWFVFARLSLFLPCVAARVIWVQSRTHGFCHAYCVHLLLRDGPLYIFVMGSLLFWFHLMQSPVCEENSPEFYRALKLYAIYSNLVSVFCLILAHWHNKLLADAAGVPLDGEPRQSAPPDTVHKLETHPYDEAVFGDEEGKLYPSECAICLATWDPEDAIKITPCGHAFHEECIGNWLQTARTCALCRQDLAAMMAVTPPPDLRRNRGSTAPAAEVVGSPSSTAEAETAVEADASDGVSRPLPGSAAVEDV